ncbi:hypothetical protein GCK72_012430 [Caenorhabditis remanei]|uniref:Nuclear receptor domain-containing protein n=1 Tax=Caenorhabditis remanei TaxID=31234 RepID=A0A6A5GKW4_CAERE|nr:hypothetical protein GCK72_012430 [Caenorhabditis remanei]KAF1755977.1 hypothetical protein GCK72_012430 [Caenorhabditis remanei]
MDSLDSVINSVASPAQLSVNVINAVVSPTLLSDKVINSVVSPAQLLDNVIDSVVSPKPPVEKPVRYCLICGDKSSGCHYGVLTCEGCKKFFCRAYDKEYQCRYKTPCAITPKTRNDCKACRLKKCREVGMHKQSQPPKPASNRPQPIDTIQREHPGQAFKKVSTKKEFSESLLPAINNVSLQPANKSPQPIDTIQQPLQPANNNVSLEPANDSQQPFNPTQKEKFEFAWITQHIHQFHLPTYGYSNERMMMMTIKDVELKTNTETLQHFINEINSDIKSFIPFTRNVPLLNGLSSEDKIILLKRHAFSIYLVRSAPAFTDCGFLLRNGGIIAWEKFHKLFYGGLGIKMKSFATAIELMHFSEAELGVFLMLIMLQPILMKDVVKTGFDNVFVLIENYALISRTLYYKLSTRDQEERLFDRIQGLLEQVNTINNLHNQTLDLIKKNLICFSVPRLFSEIFGVPRTVLDEEVAEHIRRIKESQDFLKSRGLLNIL